MWTRRRRRYPGRNSIINVGSGMRSRRRRARTFFAPDNGTMTMSIYSRRGAKRNPIQRSRPGSKVLVGDRLFTYDTSVSGRKSYHQINRLHNFIDGTTYTNSSSPGFHDLFTNLLDQTTFRHNKGLNSSVPDFYISLNSLTSVLEISNTANIKVIVKIHELSAKRDVPDHRMKILAGATLVRTLTPIHAMASGLKARDCSGRGDDQTGQLSSDVRYPVHGLGTNSALAQLSVNPKQSHLFSRYYNIAKTYTVKMDPGSSHRHVSKHSLNYMMNFLDVWTYNDFELNTVDASYNSGNTEVEFYNVGLKGIYRPLLIEIQTTPQALTTGGNTNYPPVTLNCYERHAISYSFIQDRNRSMVNVATLPVTDTLSDFSVYTDVTKVGADSI